MDVTKSRAEYRINKKGAECFRTTDGSAAYAKLKELSARKPGVYTIQTRNCHLDKHGVMLTTGAGDPIWSAWH